MFLQDVFFFQMFFCFIFSSNPITMKTWYLLFHFAHVTRHFGDQLSKKKISSWTDLNELSDSVFNAGYEFDIYFVQKLDFGIENRVLSYPKIVFSSEENFPKKSRRRYDSMQNFILYKMAYLVSTFVAKGNL